MNERTKLNCWQGSTYRISFWGEGKRRRMQVLLLLLLLQGTLGLVPCLPFIKNKRGIDLEIKGTKDIRRATQAPDC